LRSSSRSSRSDFHGKYSIWAPLTSPTIVAALYCWQLCQLEGPTLSSSDGRETRPNSDSTVCAHSSIIPSHPIGSVVTSPPFVSCVICTAFIIRFNCAKSFFASIALASHTERCPEMIRPCRFSNGNLCARLYAVAEFIWDIGRRNFCNNPIPSLTNV